MSNIVFVTGGAKSGKSAFAESLCIERNDKTGYIATSIPFDDEMKEKVRLHKERRPSNWTTYEIYEDVFKIIENVSKECDTVMLDCITLMVNNLMFKYDMNPQDLSNEELEKMDEYIFNQFEKLIEEIRSTNLYFVFVTNEIGMGVVPANKLSRIYANTAGKINQYVASHSDDVYLVISGIPVKIK